MDLNLCISNGIVSSSRLEDIQLLVQLKLYSRSAYAVV